MLTIILVLSTTFVALAQTREAAVTDVEVVINTNGVAAVVRGSLPNACTELGDPVQTIERNTIGISLPIVRRTGGVCAQAIVLFEETFPLDVGGLTPGDYTVDVNGIDTTFELTQAMIDAQSNAPSENTSDGENALDETRSVGGSTAFVERAEIRFGEDDGVNVLVGGNLPDGCTTLVGYAQINGEQSIELSLLTTRPPDVACTEGLVPFEETLPIDISSLGEGVYSVTVNGVASPPFVLSTDSASDSECTVSVGEGVIFNRVDGYCLRFPIGYTVETPQPGRLVINPPEDVTLLALTITADFEDIRTLDEITAEYADVAFEESQIGSEPALVTTAMTEMGDWQAFVVHDSRLYIFAVQSFAETVDHALLAAILDSFVFITT
jgi:hypothetical protein